jgi:hypothetical protein
VPKTTDRYEKFNRLLEKVADLDRVSEHLHKCADTAENLRAFETQRLLERARAHIEDATLILKEIARKGGKVDAAPPSPT